MSELILLASLLIGGFLVIAPSLAVWRTRAMPGAAGRSGARRLASGRLASGRLMSRRLMSGRFGTGHLETGHLETGHCGPERPEGGRVGVWPAWGCPPWLATGLAILAPGAIAYVCVVLLWLPAYSGQCGGWLGETSPCRNFVQYVGETMFWAAASMAVPGALGVLLGLAVLASGMIRDRFFRRDA